MLNEHRHLYVSEHKPNTQILSAESLAEAPSVCVGVSVELMIKCVSITPMFSRRPSGLNSVTNYCSDPSQFSSLVPNTWRGMLSVSFPIHLKGSRSKASDSGMKV